ncbi:DUF2934 domain-containing protein [Nitrosomonas marina]|uniref:DUF2934 domain-containing protein n=1 Tax=Nitrosomonas marina TaxID=917 RepID=A0A1H8F8G4_9PROT|nr:DUF2934 domain-containing protein [Nitrosomonas marina]SEN27328.1 Protein of unknown function [Nitrosomonas marina]
MESDKEQLKRTRNTNNKLSVINDSKPEIGLIESAETERNARIAVSAYYKAQARGFEPGHELEDWLLAEAEQHK